MFDVISTAKNTQWSLFPTLCTRYSYPHVANEAADFQVIPGKNCFAEFNRKFGFELLRTVNKDGKELIQRVKKRQLDDLSCGAISKVSGGEIAIGKTTGYIRFFSLETGDYLPYKFKPDRVGNAVLGMDYSNTDEYLAAVYESSVINLFGLKTGIKTDTFRFDGNSTWVRFHPVKKFALAVGSYEGAITMMDIQTKKKLFFEKSAHSAPVKDISMFDSAQDLFVTCGYDCYINVFDLRRRMKVQQHKQDHPMSSVCVSPCGTFCVAGNLKGDLISYDFRNMKDPIDTKRAHDSAVVRVAFIPSVSSSTDMTIDTVHSSSLETTSSQNATTSSRQTAGRDSFAKFVDVCHYNNVAIPDEATPKPSRNSWLDLAPAQKFHDYSMDSIAGTPSRMSFDAHNRSMRASQLMMPPRLSLNLSVISDTEPSDCSTPVAQPICESQTMKCNERKEKPVIEAKRRRITDVAALEGIQEEVFDIEPVVLPKNKMWLHKVDHKEFSNAFAAFVKNAATDTESHMQRHYDEDKENCQNNKQTRKLSILQKAVTSTPNRVVSNLIDNTEMITVNTNELNQLLTNVLDERFSVIEAEFEQHLREWRENVLTYTNFKLKEFTGHMQGRYFQNYFSNRYKSYMELEQELKMLDEDNATLAYTAQKNIPKQSEDLEDLRRQFHDQRILTNHQI